jgi:hypothetical protein
MTLEVKGIFYRVKYPEVFTLCLMEPSGLSGAATESAGLSSPKYFQ